MGWGPPLRTRRPAAASSGLRWAATGGGGERQGRVRPSESLSGSEIVEVDRMLACGRWWREGALRGFWDGGLGWGFLE